MNNPVLFIVFNRPATTRRVFGAIRVARPPKLYVAADGPRSDKHGEASRCAEVREIVTQVDWPCEVSTLFSERNLGCRFGPASAISWFFDREPQGVVLEDDCLPSQSFFRYCDGLLERYCHDERIFLISGHNRRKEWRPDAHDYFFSNYGGIWGWASWRRAWQHFDIEMSDLEYCIENKMLEFLLGRTAGRARQRALQFIKSTNMDTWDYQWGFARHKNSGLACVPARNLIENIGGGPGATHTSAAIEQIQAEELTFPLRTNRYVVPDREYDEVFVEPGPSPVALVRAGIKRMVTGATRSTDAKSRRGRE